MIFAVPVHGWRKLWGGLSFTLSQMRFSALMASLEGIPSIGVDRCFQAMDNSCDLQRVPCGCAYVTDGSGARNRFQGCSPQTRKFACFVLAYVQIKTHLQFIMNGRVIVLIITGFVIGGAFAFQHLLRYAPGDTDNQCSQSQTDSPRAGTSRNPQ